MKFNVSIRIEAQGAGGKVTPSLHRLPVPAKSTRSYWAALTMREDTRPRPTPAHRRVGHPKFVPLSSMPCEPWQKLIVLVSKRPAQHKAPYPRLHRHHCPAQEVDATNIIREKPRALKPRESRGRRAQGERTHLFENNLQGQKE